MSSPEEAVLPTCPSRHLAVRTTFSKSPPSPVWKTSLVPTTRPAHRETADDPGGGEAPRGLPSLWRTHVQILDTHP